MRGGVASETPFLLLFSLFACAARVDGCDRSCQGNFETLQRSGTCYYRCILTAIKYLLKLGGSSHDQVSRPQACLFAGLVVKWLCALCR